MKLSTVAIVTLSAFCSVAQATDTLSEVTSDVYQADGMTKEQISAKALQCIKSSAGNAAGNIEPALDGDNAYAIVKTDHTHVMTNFTLRTRITVFAKDGRFKITHTNIEEAIDMAGQFTPIYKYWGSGWQDAENTLKGWFPKVSACILKKPDQDNW